MLYHTRTRIFKSQERTLAPTAGTIVEGMALITTVVNGVGGVLASGGNSGEVFAGISLNYYTMPSQGVQVDTITVPATGPYTATLSYAPLNPTTGVSAVTADGTTSVLAYNAGVASGQFSLTGTGNQTITFNSAQAGNTYIVTYFRTLSVDEAEMTYGDSITLGAITASHRTNSVGALLSGEIWTDSIDPSANWLAPNISNLATGAGGIITRGGSGATIPGYILQAPTADVPFLGIQLNS